METVQLAKQTLSFQKTMFDNSFNAMTLVQEQSEKMLNSYLEKLPWANEESRKAMQNSIDMAKKARDDYKKAVEDGFTKFEEMLDEK